MYRKRTVLLSSVSNPSKKPVGIAVVISDGVKTSVRASINDTWRAGCFFAVKTDDVMVVRRLQNANGVCFFIRPSLLEHVRCCLLDENLAPLSYGDGRGGFLTRDFLQEIKEAFSAGDTPPQPAGEEHETRLPPKGPKGVFGDEKRETEEIKKESIATRQGLSAEKTSENGRYDDFVVATENFYEPTPVLPDPPPEARVNLAEYAKALKKFYSSPHRGSYVESVGKELEKVFESYLPYLPLMKKIENSFFVKIADKKGRFFALGLVHEGNGGDYICYALPRTTPVEDGSLVLTVEDGTEKIKFCLILQSCADGKVKRAS